MEPYLPTTDECDIIAEMANITQMSEDSLQIWIEEFCLSTKEERDTKIRWCQATIKSGKPPYQAIVQDMLDKCSPQRLQEIKDGVELELEVKRFRYFLSNFPDISEEFNEVVEEYSQ